MGRLPRAPQRTVQAALFEGAVGLLSARELIALSEDTWGHLRDVITDRRVAEPDRYLARCLLCNSGVYIRSQALNGTRLPMFVHFKGEGLECPWHYATPMKLDDVRAAQYWGQQESELHRNLCSVLADLLRADPRHRHSTVGTYHAPTATQHGRYPDVYVELEGLSPITLELQLSKSFSPEIAARQHYYRQERVGLIWVLYGIDPADPDLPQAFRDIIRRHRGNAFLFDQEAMKASIEAGTLLLWCRSRNAEGELKAPRLIRLDELTFPERGLPFFDDCRSPVLIEQGAKARKRWWEALTAKPKNWWHGDRECDFFAPAYASLIRHVPKLREFKEELYQREGRGKGHIAAVIFRLLSIALTAKEGEDRNRATKHSGKGAMVSMLNTSVHSQEFSHYAELFETLLRSTAASRLLAASSLKTHLRDAKLKSPQVQAGHPMWQAAEWLFPEVFDPILREELDSLGSLPEWAVPGEAN